MDDNFPENFDVTTLPAELQNPLQLGPMFRGDSYGFIRQTYRDQAGNLTSIDPNKDQPPPNLAAQDITGWRIVCTLKRHYSDPDNQAVIQLDTASLGGVTILIATSGRFQVQVPPLATRGFPDGTTQLYVDVKGFDTTDIPRTIGSGLLPVLPSVTSAIG